MMFSDITGPPPGSEPGHIPAWKHVVNIEGVSSFRKRLRYACQAAQLAFSLTWGELYSVFPLRKCLRNPGLYATIGLDHI